MAMTLPSFEDAPLCQMVGICSGVKDSGPQLPTDDLDIVSTYNAHSGKALARLVWNPDSGHLHIDIALRSWFRKNPPKPDTPLKRFRQTLAHFNGLAVTGYYHGAFIIPVKSLPVTGGLVFVGNSGVSLTTGGTEIELTGATLTFRKSTINKIRWDLVEDKEVFLSIDARRRDLIIDGDYIATGLKTIDSAVAAYIFGKRADGKSGI
jgi:hypothetical protein